MKTILLFITSIICLQAAPQSEQQLVTQAEKLEAGLNEQGAFETYKQVLQKNPKNYQALWKLSELCSRIGNRQASTQQKQQYFKWGKEYAQAAIKAAPNAADGYYALAVATGRLALSQSGKEKINAVKEIRANAEKALKINPQHFRAWHVIGKWHYEVSDLNMFEKAGVKLMYGGLPPASIQQSMQAYEKSKALEPNFALNYLELAKAYKRDDKVDKAIALLKQLPSLPNKTLDDARIKKEGAALLKELQD